MQHIDEKSSRDMEMEACGWDDDFWEEIGLHDLVEGHHSKIGTLPFLFIMYSCIYTMTIRRAFTSFYL